MKIFVGSTNPAKINAVKAIFPEATVEGKAVPSNVSDQPFSDEETLIGAINRARLSQKMNETGLGIGLEGGVMELKDELYVCNWGALVDQEGNVYQASGARIPLPEEVAAELKKGKELGDVMDEYTTRTGIRKKEGAVGVFTNQQVDRIQMFSHVVKLLKGQYELAQLKK